jgi:ubiquinone/menaquinone biosynthesis C-methylase UbiE
MNNVHSMSDNPFFKKYADGYVKSISHARGKDLSLLIAALPDRSNLCLDVATGTGFTAAAISRICDRVIAIDETEAMIAKAKRLMEDSGIKNVEFVKAAFEDYKPDDKFDVITIRRALHHFKDKDKFFEKSRNLLNDKGILAIADMVSPEEDLYDDFNTLERIRDPTHAGAPKVSEYRRMAEKHHMKIISLKTEIEDFKFEEWISPVPMDSDASRNCLAFLESLAPDRLRNIHFDMENLILKKDRIIITLSKGD